jgi:DNA-directed RNA polymerase specialized sigma24 family protein
MTSPWRTFRGDPRTTAVSDRQRPPSGRTSQGAPAVSNLPESQKLALYLRFLRHMDYDEIAEALECSVPAARQHFHLGVKAVRNRLFEDRDD